MEIFKIGKKGLFFFTSILIIAMVVHLFYTNMAVDGEVPSVWAIITIMVIIEELKKESRKGILRNIFIKCGLSMIMVLNYVLFRFSMNIPNYILFFIVMCSYLIIVYNNSFNKYKIFFLISIVSLLLIFFGTDYYIKSNNIIKDISFRRDISREYDIKGKIEPNDLENIEKLSIDSLDINNIKGIEYFKNLKELYIDDAYKIDDFSYLSSLNKVEYMEIWDMDLDDLESMGQLKSLQHLEIVYPKYGELNNLKNFPNLKELYIQGMDNMENLKGIKGPKDIKTLELSYSQIVNFDGIEEFENLEELYLYKISSSDTSKILELKKLKKVTIHSYRIYKQDEFIQNLKDKGIEVKME